MQGVHNVYAVTIYAIHQSEVIFLAFVGVISTESLHAILSFLGKFIILKNIHREMVATRHCVLQPLCIVIKLLNVTEKRTRTSL